MSHPFEWKAAYVENYKMWTCYSKLRLSNRVLYDTEELAQKQADELNQLEKWDENYPPETIASLSIPSSMDSLGIE